MHLQPASRSVGAAGADRSAGVSDDLLQDVDGRKRSGSGERCGSQAEGVQNCSQGAACFAGTTTMFVKVEVARAFVGACFVRASDLVRVACVDNLTAEASHRGVALSK